MTYPVIKDEIQIPSRLIHIKITNFGYLCNRGQILSPSAKETKI